MEEFTVIDATKVWFLSTCPMVPYLVNLSALYNFCDVHLEKFLFNEILKIKKRKKSSKALGLYGVGSNFFLVVGAASRLINNILLQKVQLGFIQHTILACRMCKM